MNSTWVSMPDTWGRSVTVVEGITVPSASMITGSSALRTTASPTVTMGRPPPGKPGPPLDSPLARWMRYHAAPPTSPTNTSASRLPTHRDRRGGLPGGAGGMADGGGALTSWGFMAVLIRVLGVRAGRVSARSTVPNRRGSVHALL
ncbi:hypothetical protein D3C71_1553570 [compost metagenome]